MSYDLPLTCPRLMELAQLLILVRVSAKGRHLPPLISPLAPEQTYQVRWLCLNLLPHDILEHSLDRFVLALPTAEYLFASSICVRIDNNLGVFFLDPPLLYADGRAWEACSPRIVRTHRPLGRLALSAEPGYVSLRPPPQVPTPAVWRLHAKLQTSVDA